MGWSDTPTVRLVLELLLGRGASESTLIHEGILHLSRVDTIDADSALMPRSRLTVLEGLLPGIELSTAVLLLLLLLLLRLPLLSLLLLLSLLMRVEREDYIGYFIVVLLPDGRTLTKRTCCHVRHYII